jgi:hypothetical protein
MLVGCNKRYMLIEFCYNIDWKLCNMFFLLVTAFTNVNLHLFFGINVMLIATTQIMSQNQSDSQSLLYMSTCGGIFLISPYYQIDIIEQSIHKINK